MKQYPKKPIDPKHDIKELRGKVKTPRATAEDIVLHETHQADLRKQLGEEAYKSLKKKEYLRKKYGNDYQVLNVMLGEE